jgi:hypothetical protein
LKKGAGEDDILRFRFSRFLQLPSQSKLFDDLVILVYVRSLEIIKQLSPARDHFEQAPARVIVLFVHFEVLGQLIDPLRQKRDLYLRRTGVRTVRPVIVNYLFLCFFCCRHKNRPQISLSLLAVTPRS